MQALPSHVIAYKKTPEFNQDTVPAGLLKQHATKEGTWGKIIILEGQLRYRILEPSIEEIMLNTSYFGVVEPTILHEVETVGSVRFLVEFYR